MKELLKLFFKLGAVGFGGPVASMGLIEEEVSQKRDWISPAQFSQVYTVLKLFPGPFSTQMAIYIGTLRAGLLGGVLSGIVFIAPSVASVLFLSYLYQLHGAANSNVDTHLFLGFQLGALIIIFQAIIQMAKPFFDDKNAWGVGATAGALVYFFPRYEPLILLAFGLLGVGLMGGHSEKQTLEDPAHFPVSPPLYWLLIAYVPAIICSLSSDTLARLYWTMFKAGAFVFGTGLAILPLLEGDTVRHFHWLTHSQFMDGLAIGQITPGPIVTAASFIGFIVHGWLGALLGTIGIFMPAFFNVLFVLPKVCAKMLKSPKAIGFMKFAIPAVVGAIFASSVRLGNGVLEAQNFVPQWQAWILLLIALGISLKIKVPGWLLILVCGGLGVGISFF